MTMIDIASLLPDPDQGNYEQIKREHPFNILTRYAEAIGHKYPGKLAGMVAESSDLEANKLMHYALHVLAAIGKGYSYRLLEVVPITTNMYPVQVTLFEDNPHEFGIARDYTELEKLLQQLVQSGFTQTLLLNLVAQVDLYNENRAESF